MSLTTLPRPTSTQILAGAVVAQGELDAQITAIGANTFFGKTMTLLGAPEEKGHLQKVLGRVSAVLGLFALAGEKYNASSGWDSCSSSWHACAVRCCLRMWLVGAVVCRCECE